MITRLQLGRISRCFSSTAHVQAFISHVGSKAIPVPPSVTIKRETDSLHVRGPLGDTAVSLRPYMKIDFPQPENLAISVEDPSVKEQRSMWGLTRTLIHNAIIGMTEGFSVPLYLVGVGYRVALEEDPRGDSDGGNGQRLHMKVGYSHSVYIPIPKHIKAEVPTATKIVLFCTNKHDLGLFAANVRSHRKPEPYKGKVRLRVRFEVTQNN